MIIDLKGGEAREIATKEAELPAAGFWNTRIE